MRWTVTPDIIQSVLDGVNKGKSIRQSCVDLNVENHYGAIQSYLKKHHIHSRYSCFVTNNIKDSHLDEIIYLYTQERMNLQQLGQKYNVSPSTITSWLRESGIPLRTLAEATKKRRLDSQYFDVIDSCSKAYVLGFLAADGYVTDKNGIGFGIKASDIDILLFIKQQWKCDNKIRVKRKKPNNAAILQVESKHMASSLKELSIIPRKTYQLDPQKILSKAQIDEGTELEKSFLLGYFDGDGGICHFIPSDEQRRIKHYAEMFTMSVTGTRETCEYYYNFANGIGYLHQRHPDRPVNNWTYSVSGRNQCRKVLTPLYEVKDKIGFCLQRKYNLFQML